jgi:hypothetical protein
VSNSFALEHHCLIHHPLASSDRRQARIRFHKVGRHLDCSLKRSCGVVVLMQLQQQRSLIVPKYGIRWIEFDGTPDNLDGQIEVIDVRSVPSLLGQSARTSSVLVSLSLAVHIFLQVAHEER